MLQRVLVAWFGLSLVAACIPDSIRAEAEDVPEQVSLGSQQTIHVDGLRRILVLNPAVLQASPRGSEVVLSGRSEGETPVWITNASRTRSHRVSVNGTSSIRIGSRTGVQSRVNLAVTVYLIEPKLGAEGKPFRDQIECASVGRVSAALLQWTRNFGRGFVVARHLLRLGEPGVFGVGFGGAGLPTDGGSFVLPFQISCTFDGAPTGRHRAHLEFDFYASVANNKRLPDGTYPGFRTIVDRRGSFDLMIGELALIPIVVPHHQASGDVRDRMTTDYCLLVTASPRMIQ